MHASAQTSIPARSSSMSRRSEGSSERRSAGRPKLTAFRPIDIHIGSRVRLRRTLLGMSQEKLGEALNLTFQQVQKYERGANRISAGTLFALSGILDVPISFFYDDMTEETKTTCRAEPSEEVGDEQTASSEPDPMAKRETLELVRAYYKINDPTVRKRLFELTKAMGKVDLSSAPADGGDLTA